MNTSIIIATYGEDSWERMAQRRALPSVSHLGAEVLVGHDPEGTISSVRNELAAQATGEWLLFLDADDEFAPGYVQAMEDAQQERGLLTPIVQQVTRGRRRRPAFYPQVDLASGNWLVIGTSLQRSLFIEAQGFEDYPHGFEDWSLWSKCAKLGAHVVKVPRAVYIQHMNPRSKHRLGWRDRQWQVDTHLRVQSELEAWTP